MFSRLNRAGVSFVAGMAAFLALPGVAAPASLPAVERDEVRAHTHALVVARGLRAQAALRRAGAVQVARSVPIWRVGSNIALRLAPLLDFVEADRAIPASSHFSSGDPLVPNQWWISAIRADAAEPPGPGKPVTVIDTGLDLTHPEFAGRPATTPLNSQSLAGPEEEHGTAVSSAVAAPANGLGVVGVYPQAALQVWDASPSGPPIVTSQVVAGLDAAIRRGPGVVNLSLAAPFRDPLLESMIAVTVGTGSLVVAASGNDRFEGNRLEYPASLPHVLTAGAIDQTGRSASFSSGSPFVDLVAPGQMIPVAVPLTANPSGYQYYSGTSFAAPLVAGAAAWVWTARPTLDVSQLFDLMRSTAQDIEAPGFDAFSGFGRLDIPSALTAPPLLSDPSEPNEDVDHIRPRGLFRQAARPITAPGRTKGSLRARLDVYEDPRDVYRFWVPGRRVTAISLTPNADVDLAVWGPRTVSVFEVGRARKRDLRKVSERPGTRRETVLIRNTTRRGSYCYAEASPGTSRTPLRRVGAMSYRIAVSTGPLPRPHSARR